MFIETSGECAMHCTSTRKRSVTDTGLLFHRFSCRFGEEGAQMFKNVYSFYSAFYTQPEFYSQSAVCILHSACILPLVRTLRFTLTVSRMPQVREGTFFLGEGEGVRGPGYFRIFCEKSRGPPTSWNGLMHDPSKIPKQKTSDPPPLPIQDKNNWT